MVLCGPAASGKTTFAERHFRTTQVISSDRVWARVCDDEKDQRFSVQAFNLVYFLIEQRLTLNRLCVVDSTALTAGSRKGLLDLAKRFHVPAVAMILDVPLEVCVARDEKRDRSVGRDVVERQYHLFELAKSAIRQEGFDQLIEIGDRDLDNVRIEIVFRPVPRQPQKPESGAARHPERPGAAGMPKSNGNDVPAKPLQLGYAPDPQFRYHQPAPKMAASQPPHRSRPLGSPRPRRPGPLPVKRAHPMNSASIG